MGGDPERVRRGLTAAARAVVRKLLAEHVADHGPRPEQIDPNQIEVEEWPGRPSH